ncbi:MAG: AMP-binding protein [Desulfomonilaceae bacterium]|nr:AMP-binding protein [Desulfomonilaceae bacterium]
MGIHDYTIYHVLRRNARIHRNRTALVFEHERVTYGELVDRVESLSSGLVGAGVLKGDRVAVLSQNCLEYVYLYAAAAKLGAILLPINWRLNADEIAHVLSDGSPRILIVDSQYQSVVTPLLSAGSVSMECYGMDAATGPFRPFQDLARGGEAVPDGEPSDMDGWVIMHTAAVHGKARGAVLTHRGPLLVGSQLVNCFRLTHEDANMVMVPLFHAMGLIMTVSVMIAAGTNVIVSRFDVDRVLDKIAEERVTVFGEFAPILKSLLDRASETGRDLSSTRHVVGLDLPETIERYQRETGGTFWAAYGQSETSGLSTVAPYSEKPGSAGRPFHFTEVEIVDEAGNRTAPGTSGEIVTRGPMVFRGYWNLEQETAYTLRDGWHHTGDMGRLDEDGYLWFEGRAPEKELIKPGGENVYPAEVEKAILEHEAVKETVVIGVPDAKWGEAIKAVCVLEEGACLTGQELIDFVAGRIARYKKPQHVVFVAELPKTESGAADRKQVKAVHG